MTIFRHELRLGKIALLIWSAAISFMLALCILIYPEMAEEMGQVSKLFASMGAFSQAFGLDQINYGEFLGFFCVECGNVLGLGGAFFAALIGVSALAKEEKEHTAEFLLTHPVSRTRVIGEKFCAVAAQIAVLNLICIAVTALSVLIIGEDVEIETMGLLFLAYFLMQLEVGAITFGISAFLRRGSLGVGLGLAACFYFLNLISNLVDETEFLKYITPFGYTEGADIIKNHALNGGYLAAGMAAGAIAISLAFWKYIKKDIA